MLLSSLFTKADQARQNWEAQWNFMYLTTWRQNKHSKKNITRGKLQPNWQI